MAKHYKKKDPHPIVKALRDARKAQAISQIKLGQLLGCSRSKIEHIELGLTSTPTLDFLEAWAKVVGLELTAIPREEETKAS